MTISFRCLFCDKQYQVRDSQAGQEIRCRSCGASLSVPEDDYRPRKNQDDRSSNAYPGKYDPSVVISENTAKLTDDLASSSQQGTPKRSPLPKAETSSSFRRIVAVVFVLAGMLLPLSKIMLRQMRPAQRRPPAVQNPFHAMQARLNWNVFTPEESDFTIDVPEVIQNAALVPPYASREYRWDHGMMSGAITVVDLTFNIAKDIPHTTIYALFQSSILNKDQPHYSKLTQNTTPEFHEFYSESGVKRLNCRLVIAGSQLFIVKFAYHDPLVPEASRTVARYFDSFRIHDPQPIIADEKPEETYQKRRLTFEKKISREMPAPQDWKVHTAPPNVEVVRYRSGEYEFPAWLAIPDKGEQRKQPAFVYLHGGNAFDRLDFEFCKPALDAGFVVLVPIFRGENGNAGHFEAMLGEADDAAAAVEWLSRHDAVDPDKIYVFGHDFGGGISGLLSLRDDVPIRHTGSCAGLYHDFSFYVWALSDTLPFPLGDKGERDMRLLLSNLDDMQRPHHAYVGNNDYIRLFLPTISRKLAERAVAQPLLQIEAVAGDHITSLDESIRRYVEFMKSDVKGNSANEQKPSLIDPNKKTFNL